jgi:hypothetical protein
MVVSEQGRWNLTDRRRGFKERQQQQMHGRLESSLNHNPMLIFLRFVVPALELYASTWCTQLVVEEKHHVVCIRPSQVLCRSEDCN